MTTDEMIDILLDENSVPSLDVCALIAEKLKMAEQLSNAVDKHWAGDGYALSEALLAYRKAGGQ